MEKVNQNPLPGFVAECTLGTLAKWMRLAGLDTLYDAGAPDPWRLKKLAVAENRIVLTRTHAVFLKLGTVQGLFVRSNHTMEQARQVVKGICIQQNQLKPLTRCSCCNQSLEPVPKSSLKGRVPGYVWQHHDQFVTCVKCGRVYWPGTHVTRTLACIGRWFDD